MQVNAKMPTLLPFSGSTGTAAMDQHFQALPISIRDARSAYPLIYLHDASISLEEWLRFARRHCRHPSDRTGLIAIRDRRELIHAVFGYRIDIDLRAHKRLCLHDLVVARTPGSQVDEAILVSANELAARFVCQTITLEQPFSRRTGTPRACPTAHDLLTSPLSFIRSAQRH